MRYTRYHDTVRINYHFLVDFCTIGMIMKARIPTTTSPMMIFSLQFLQYIILSNSVALLLNSLAFSEFTIGYISMILTLFRGYPATLGCWESYAHSISLRSSPILIYVYFLSLPLCYPHLVTCWNLVLLHDIFHVNLAVGLEHNLYTHTSTSSSVL